MNRNITGKPDEACFGNVLKDVKNKAAGGEDESKKVMTVLPYNQDTCYPLSSFQVPHQPWDGQIMFNPVQLGCRGCGWAVWLPYAKLIIHSPWICLLSMLNVCVLLCTMDDRTVIKYGHRTTLREYTMKVAELVVKS